MTSSFIKRVGPFALAFLCGVAVWQLVGFKLQALSDIFYLEYGAASPVPGGRGGTWAAARPEGEGSRTWLVISSTPAGAWAANGRECEGCSVRMHVQFGADGLAVPGNDFSLSPSSYPLIEEAVAAAREIEFTPATRDGRPITVWANATYACVPRELRPHSGAYRHFCSLTVDRDTARTWNGRPWRLIYE